MKKNLCFISVATFLFISCNQEIQKLPFSYRGNIFLRCLINDSIPANLMFDTGASDICLDSTFTLQEGLNVQIAATIKDTGLFAKPIVRPDNFRISIDTFKYKPKYVDVQNIRRAFGKNCDGVVGWQFFEKYLVEINYQDSCLNIHLPSQRFIGKGWSVTPLLLHDEKWYLLSEVQIAPGLKVAGNYLFDTGFMSSVLFTNRTADTFGFASLPIKKLIAGDDYLSVYNYKTNGYIFRGKSMQIGSEYLSDPLLEKTSQDFPELTVANFRGLIGNKVLERFHVIIDFPNKQLFLKPNQKHNIKMHLNTIGFNMKEVQDRSSNYEVSAIFKNTQADSLGIRPGDLIVSINGRKCSEVNQNSLHKLLNTSEQPMTFVIKRNAQLLKLSLRVKEQLQ